MKADELVSVFMQGIEAVRQRDDKNMNGIHGTMSIAMTDGASSLEKCPDCPCVKKNKGVCPCCAEQSCSSPAR